jgi:hypothetical protein
MSRPEAAFDNQYSSLKDEPLSDRGWALQERYLASRVLHFGTKQVYFECYNHFRAEDGFRSKGRFTSIRREFHPSELVPNRRGYSQSIQWEQYRIPSLSLWYDILVDYYGRKLTKSSDKLPALSGIARAFETMTKDRYVAGLWRSNMIEGLLWQAMGSERRATSRPSQYRAPTWSWASIDGPFGYPGLGKDIFDSTMTQIDVGTVLDCHVELQGENPYGEVKAGSVILKAPLEPLVPSTEKEPDWETVPHKRAMRVTTKTGDKFGVPCIFDTLSGDQALELPLYALFLTRRKPVDDIPEKRVYQGLIVSPVEGERDKFSRLGKILAFHNSIGECDWMTDESKFVTVTLI